MRRATSMEARRDTGFSPTLGDRVTVGLPPEHRHLIDVPALAERIRAEAAAAVDWEPTA